MRGILSFLLVMLLAESLLLIYAYHNAETKSSYYVEEQAIHLQNFYDKKIKIKRTVQNLIAAPTKATNPYNKIEEVAERLENYESQVEQDEDYKIDLWCGYVNSLSLSQMLESAKAGIFIKNPLVFDPSEKVTIVVRGIKIELHACSSVLITEHNTDIVRIGRGQLYTGEDISQLVPAVGIIIVDEKNGIYDVDYVEEYNMRR